MLPLRFAGRTASTVDVIARSDLGWGISVAVSPIHRAWTLAACPARLHDGRETLSGRSGCLDNRKPRFVPVCTCFGLSVGKREKSINVGVSSGFNGNWPMP
jgi:hypothetical protein